jgi:[protein-PII] uridylyltransferase
VRSASPPDWARVERDLRAAVAGSLDVGQLLEQRVRHGPRFRKAQAAALPVLEVIVSNHDSATTTMLDVRAPDAVAVLYRLAAALRDLGLDIRSAKVATLGHEVVDVFYVDRVPEDRHEPVRSALRAALVGT